LHAFYTALLRLRKTMPALATLDKAHLEARVLSDRLLMLRRWNGESQIIAMMNFADEPAQVVADFPAGSWQKQLDSADTEWGGPGSAITPVVAAQDQLILMPHGCALFSRIAE